MAEQKSIAVKRKFTTLDDEHESTKEIKRKKSADTTPGTSSSSYSPSSDDNQPANLRRVLPGQTSEEQFIDADDDITAFFAILIDPEGTSHDPGASVPDFYPATSVRSRLKLEGLKMFEPQSFDRESKGFRLSGEEDVEIDGVDAVDGPVDDESELSLADVSEQEKQRRYKDVAQRLRAIADSFVIKRGSESAESSSEHESHTHRRRVSQSEEEPRQYGNIGEQVRSALSKINVSETIIPSVMQILQAQDYSSFLTVVKREIENTVGWEQVAWYTYLIKITMDVVKVGQCLASKVKNHATRYFNSNIRPWIQSRPLGWESILEETDTDSELG